MNIQYVYRTVLNAAVVIAENVEFLINIFVKHEVYYFYVYHRPALWRNGGKLQTIL